MVTIFILTLLAFVLIALGFKFAPLLKVSFAEALGVFVAFYLLLLGLRFMVASTVDDGIFVGGLLASLALTFFWAMWRKQSAQFHTSVNQLRPDPQQTPLPQAEPPQPHHDR